MRIMITSIMLLLLLSSCRDNSSLIVTGVKDPVISLNGKWKVSNISYEDAMDKGFESEHWTDVVVPGELMMQGIPVRHDQPVLYSRMIGIPADYSDKTIMVRFEGVYSYARVFVNGHFVRDHFGGFTSWDCDITDYAGAGGKVMLYVEVTDRADEISYASGYAKHQIGGILRSVSLLALPAHYPEKISVTTDLDEDYEDAILTVNGITKGTCTDCSIELELFDPEDSRVRLLNSSSVISDNHFIVSNPVKSPVKWDAEHPFLYTLRISFIDNGRMLWRKDIPTGFREVEVKGNEFLVNGKPVKFRGACRHDIHPLLGRMTTPDYDLKDVFLAKEANMNFIRTSHYPPSEKFLEYCDRYGLFVEDETAVCFVGSHRTKDYYPGSTENSPEFTGRYLSQLEEMIDNHRNHPSVIMWSIGNENNYGTNFKLSFEWVKKHDPSRPVIFSYPGHVPDTTEAYDVISMHYPATSGNMVQYGLAVNAFGHDKKPVIFDEWAHVPCYNQQTVIDDPNVRDFWGMSLDTMFQKVFEAEGGLGGAIWGMIDETFMLPADLPGYNEWWGRIDKNVIPASFTGHTVGYGEWGFIDTWRRKKPEFLSVKKAYSPVRIMKTEEYVPEPGKTINLLVHNRYDFTNLNEITASIKWGGSDFTVSLPDIPPHTKGIFPVRLPDSPGDGFFEVSFTDRQGNVIDMYNLSEEIYAVSVSEYPGDSVSMEINDTEYIISCSSGTVFTLSRATGLFLSYKDSAGLKKFSGPYLNFFTAGQKNKTADGTAAEWKTVSAAAEIRGSDAVVSIKGTAGAGIKAEYTLTISGSGVVKARYHFSGLPDGLIREAGIHFIIGNCYNTLKWERKTYWSGYSGINLSGPSGEEPLYTSENNKYRAETAKEWIYDKKSFFYNGIADETSEQLTNVARATKENIYKYCLLTREGKGIAVEGYGKKSCRIWREGDMVRLFINDIVDYPDIGWGNYSADISQDTLSGNTVFSIL